MCVPILRGDVREGPREGKILQGLLEQESVDLPRDRTPMAPLTLLDIPQDVHVSEQR